jgi:hypothetical protein
LLAHGRWFSPGTPASSITKNGRHDIAEILLEVALNTKNQIKIKYNQKVRTHRGHDRMIVGFTTTYAISTYRH